MTEHRDADRSQQLLAAIEAARADQRALYINGGGSKRQWLGRVCEATPLEIGQHRGIVDYQAAELVLTARAGTPLTEITRVLAEQGQALASDPPLFQGQATLGGTLACNLSGPARPWSGSLRDAVLGVQLINGKGQLLNFGGRVMKNVAGYDVSRLQAGALGTLGVITQVSLKVMPMTEHSLSLAFEMDAARAVETMNRRAAEPKPLSGAYWLQGRLILRLSGAAQAVAHTARLWGGEVLDNEEAGWQGLRDMSLPFFGGEAPLWRLSLKSTTPPASQAADMLIDWAGAQRWLRGERDALAVRQQAAQGQGHAALVRGGDRSSEVRQPLGPLEQRLQLRLKRAFDPEGIFNPGRLYGWM